MVRGLYMALLKDINVIARQVSLIKYLLGEYIHCNTPWAEIDRVLMLIRIGTCAHWILGHLDIERRCINIYNSCWGTIRDIEVIADVQAFAFVIPHLMAIIDVWQLAIVDVRHLLNAVNSFFSRIDCGVFVIKYAEYIINNNIQGMPNPFDATFERTHLASLLYKYVMEKMGQGYETDPDFPTRKAMRAAKKKKPT
ncbi:Ulp1 protease family [Abeliophyllum distichum]|uniref:Ulp1 protease family n=1 Tax=Abeliophyllum distichum TaxID=126358 RepID=A0ABD1PNG3_9LAMI